MEGSGRTNASCLPEVLNLLDGHLTLHCVSGEELNLPFELIPVVIVALNYLGQLGWKEPGSSLSVQEVPQICLCSYLQLHTSHSRLALPQTSSCHCVPKRGLAIPAQPVRLQFPGSDSMVF